MKKLAAVLVCLMSSLMAIPAMADTDINITVNTDEDTNLWTNLNVGGNVNWWFNGYPGILPAPVINNNNYGLDLGQIKDAIDFITGVSYIKANEYTISEIYNIFPGLNLIDQLVRIFVTRAEYENVVQDLNWRVTALEKTINEINSTNYCDAKLEVMVEYNLTSVMCGNVTYYKNNGSIIGLEQIE